MEDLRVSVYECTLAVEAHMICDLLARAGISARVDGEFLAGAAGELPLGSMIKVRVDPARASEAREVIDEWERMQPPPEPAAIRPRSHLQSPLWFLAGILVGAAALYVASRSPATSQSVDFDGDGVEDETYHYEGVTLARVDYDRNADGKVDARWTSDIRGTPVRHEADDDFDGRFEWTSDAERGQSVISKLDSNGDGRPDLIDHARNGVLSHTDVYDEAGTRVVARHTYEHSLHTFTEFDSDGDGVFERRVEWDRYGEAKAK